MKNLLLTFSLLILGTSMFGQNIIEEKFQHLYDHDKATVVHVTGKLFGYAEHFKDTSDEDLNRIADFASTIDAFTLVAMKEWPNSKQEYSRGMDYIHQDLEELVRVRSEEGNFSLYIDESNDIVNELVGIGTDNENFVVFSLTGEMDLEEIGKMATEIQMEGFNKMESIEKYDISAVKVYPNPAKSNDNITLELPEEWDNAKANVYDEKGSLVTSTKATKGKQNLNLSNLTPGIYYVDIQKEGVNVKKKIVITN